MCQMSTAEILRMRTPVCCTSVAASQLSASPQLMIDLMRRPDVQGSPDLRQLPITSKAWRPDGDGAGGSIVLVAETDTSCIFGASGAIHQATDCTCLLSADTLLVCSE